MSKEKIILGLFVVVSIAVIISPVFVHPKVEYVVIGLILDYLLAAAYGCTVDTGF